jgi:hypothetical protein
LDDEARNQSFLTALVTEHFVLQSTRGTITGEATGRAALYLGALSSALIALGFAATKASVFGPFVAAVLPLVVVLGVFTFLRLVEIGLEDVQHLQAMQRIRRYYRSLVPEGPQYFPDIADEEELVGDVNRYMAVSMTVGLQLLLTAASAIGMINSIVAGVGIALAVSALGGGLAWSASIGGGATVLFVVQHLRYELKRARAAM